MFRAVLTDPRSTETCAECGTVRERCRQVARLVDNVIVWCCPQCWKRWDYDLALTRT